MNLQNSEIVATAGRRPLPPLLQAKAPQRWRPYSGQLREVACAMPAIQPGLLLLLWSHKTILVILIPCLE